MQVLLDDISFKGFVKFYFFSKIVRLAEYFYFVIPNWRRIQKIKQLKNIKFGKSAFVFAGGSSISKLDAEKILEYKSNGYDVFAGNSFIASELGKKVTPDFYFLSDDKFFKHKDGEKYNYFSGVLDSIKKLSIPIFIPHRYANLIEKNSNFFVFNDTIDLFSNNITDLTKPRPYVSMTLYKALSLACFMGYSKIYICGFDNDYFKEYQCNEINEIFYEDKHFYTDEIGEKTIRKVDKNVHKSMSSLLLHISTLFSGLEKFKNYPILNLDKQSLVDCFEKQHNLNIYK
jgi:hypothetical protein